MTQDIRWHQRFENYKKAIRKLNEAVNRIKNGIDNGQAEEEKTAILEMLKEALIQRFEYTHELAWNVMKDYAIYQGNNTISGSRDATREAFKMGLITDAEDWMDMLKSRNLTTHTYNPDTADEIYNKIVLTYQSLFVAFEQKMESFRVGSQSAIFDKEV